MNPQKPSHGVFVPTREFVTEQQIASCLAVLRELQPYVITFPAASWDGSPPPERPELDGGIKASVSTTIMAVCDRLDRVMKEDARWDISGTTDLFKALAKTQEAQQEFLREQAASARIVQLPHYQLRPQLMHDGEQYFAVWGDLSLPGGRIIGAGRSPAAALEDFDAAFERAPAEQLQLILEQVEPSETDTPTTDEKLDTDGN